MLLASFIISPVSALLRGTRTTVAQVTRGVKHVATVVRHRRDVARLTELSAHELKDIGLVRADVIGALEGNWLDDPSRALTARSDSMHDVATARRDLGALSAKSAKSPADCTLLPAETCTSRAA